MVNRGDAPGGTTDGPERLFACDPELARIRTLLESDGPPDGVADRVLARIGTRPARLPTGPRVSRSALALSLVAGAALLAAVASELARPTAGISSDVPSVMLVPAGPAALPPTAPGAPSVPAEPVRVEDLPPAPPPAASSSASAGEAFELELALVERARAALAKGRGAECLDVAAQHRKRFSNRGQFHEEIEVMRIEALAMTGERARARAQAALLLEQHGDTPYAERLHRVLQLSAGEP